jgi:hypothetical protein
LDDTNNRPAQKPYGVIHRGLWERPDFAAMPFGARALFPYLRTCPQGGLIGVFRLHDADVVEHLGMPAKQVPAALRDLEEHAFIVRLGKWVWIPDALTTAPGMSPANRNHRRAVEKALQQVPPPLIARFRALHAEWVSPVAPEVDPGSDS